MENRDNSQENKIDVLAVTLVSITLVLLFLFCFLSTERLLSMSEAELFENLTANYRILEDFHPSVATYVAWVSLTILWIMFIVYLTCCILISVRWLKERKK